MLFRTYRHVFVAVALVAGLAGSAQADVIFSNHMERAQEFPAIPAGPGSGSVVATLNAAMTMLTIVLTENGDLSGPITASHIHFAAGAYGTSGGVVHNIGGAWAGTITSTWAIPAVQVTNLMNGDLYANVHTAAFGGGEIRGQLDQQWDANLDPQQETPSLTNQQSMGRGHSIVRWNDVENRIEITNRVVSPLTGPVMASHIHRGAPGVAGPVVFAFAPPTPTSTAVWAAVPAAEEANLVAGLLYVNFHTAAFGGGEVRGQLFQRAMTSVEPGLATARSSGLRSFPNPMTSDATVQFSLPGAQHADLMVVDVTGREVAHVMSGLGRSGENEVVWNGRDRRGSMVPSGVYYYVLRTDGREETDRKSVV